MPLGTKNIEYFSDPNKFYRVVQGNEVYDDIVESGKIRTIGSSTYQGAPSRFKYGGIDVTRPSAWPSFAKGKVALSYAQDNPNHYIVESQDKSIKPSKSGRHSKGSTHFPSDELGNPLEKGLDAKKAKIWKHTGDGKYKRVSPRLEKIGRSLLTGLSEFGKGVALAPAFEFMNPPSLNVGATYSEYTEEQQEELDKKLKALRKEEEKNLARLNEYLKQ